ncbi:hypothetical protein SISSUDRAFT_1130656 [Sistotremastrum suecicum HHB10207 ss-3]|uniref:F-box domain-containing protein n=1 Tax=Sistotremastrum suecicum HHB10207 ss-3 TaxID=1314776 RepID=A0A166B764_9AGAM|nr:hypothetical protein SISSUDRAFT_1130656 [Sistotremastrum suecicum HHB10207 ss-3]
MPGLVDMPSLVLEKILDDSSLQSEDLARCARTCTTLSAYAINKLYRDIPNLIEFLDAKLVPIHNPAETIEAGVEPSELTFRTSRDITPEDWDRFAPHAALVRNVEFSHHLSISADDEQINEAILRELCTPALPITSTSPIFPGIQHLTWVTDSNLSPRPFIHHTLRSLEIHWIFAHRRDFLGDLWQCCPNLVDINLRGMRADLWSVADMNSLIRLLDKLERVSISKTGISLFYPLRNRSRLKSLRLSCYPGDEFLRSDPQSDAFHVDIRVWQDLTRLSLEIDHAEFVTLFNIPRNRSDTRTPSPVLDLRTKMHDLNGTFSHPGSSRSIICVLGQQFASLHSLKIILPTAINLDIPVAYDFDDFAPLLNLHNMTYFTINDHLHLIMTEDDVKTLVAAWPQIKVLHLPNCPPTDDPRPFTALNVNSLLIFADNCPCLEEPELLINAEQIPPDFKRLKGRRFSEHFRRLDLGHSPLPDSLGPVVAFLTYVLPAAITLGCSGYQPRGHGRSNIHRRWNRVCNILDRVWWVRGTGSKGISRKLWHAIQEALEDPGWVTSDSDPESSSDDDA